MIFLKQRHQFLWFVGGYALIIILGCPTTPPSDPEAGLYHTYHEIERELQRFANDFPHLARVTSIGQSIEGRELWAIKISDRVEAAENETTLLFLGGHHAREWIAVDVPFLIAKHLLENYDNDTLITRLVNNAEIWIVPLVNPDGHQYSVTTNRLWRKNRRNNGDGTYGVDLNRNYEHAWGGPGSSGDTFSEIYRGSAPFSEPETRAVRDFVQQQSPDALISYHNFSQLILYPWGHWNDPAPDKPLLHQLAATMADKIRAVQGMDYTPQQASELYLVSGDTVDWLYALLAAPGFTIELRPRSSNPGFELPENQIQGTFEENLPAALFIIDWVVKQHAGYQKKLSKK